MYIYIVHRTQIYLSDEVCAWLDEEAARTGRTRSQLIREAIDIVYLRRNASSEPGTILDATAGAWKRRRETGAQYVDRLRRGRLAGLHAADEEP